MAAVIAPMIVGAGASVSALAAATLGVNVALYAGTTALSYFISQPEQAATSERGSNLSVALGGAVPQKIGFGRIETAGHLSYAGTCGRSSDWPNNYAVRQYVLFDYPIEGGVGIWYGGRKCTVDWESPFTLDGALVGYPITTFRKSGADYKWVKILTGGQNAADPWLRVKFGSADKRPYGAARVGFGRAIAVLTERYDKKKYTSLGEPRFVVDAMKCYDPRKDSTNGGSGSHRWGTPNTHEHTTNLAVVYYNIRRGIYYDGERLFGGLNYPAYMLDNDSYFAAMNACDENVSLKGGGTEKRYVGGGEIDISGRVTDALDKLLTCMNGRVVEAGGISRLYVGGVGANVLSITDDDIVITEPEDGEEGPDPDEIFNTVTGVYTEPGDAGEAIAFRKKADADALARDGEELTRALDQIYCRSNSQAQRVAKAAAKEGQRWIKRGIVLPPWARVLKPTNCIGWSAKKFIVGDVTPLRNGNVHVKLREANASDTDWTDDDEDDWDVGGYDDETLAAENFTADISAVSITDDDGTGRRPGLLFEPSSAVLGGDVWANVKADYENARALLFQVRKKNGGQKVIVPDGRIDDFFEDGTAEFTHNAFLAGLKVQVRVRVELIGGQLTDWPATWTDVTLTNARFANADIAVDAVDTDNVVVKAIGGRDGWTSDNQSKSWSGISKTQKTKPALSLGASNWVKNPVPNPVALRIKYKATAQVISFSAPGSGLGVAAQFTTTVSIWSIPEKQTGPAGVEDTAAARLVHKSAIKGTLMFKKGKSLARNGGKNIDATVVDIYEGKDGNAPRRKYRAEVEFKLEPGKYATNVKGKGSVTNFNVQIGYPKR